MVEAGAREQQLIGMGTEAKGKGCTVTSRWLRAASREPIHYKVPQAPKRALGSFKSKRKGKSRQASVDACQL